MRFYGEDNFSNQLLEQIETQDEANLREDFWINKHKTLDKEFGYNLMTGGSFDRVYTEETLQKMSEAKLGKLRGPFSEEHKQRLSTSIKESLKKNPIKRQPRTEEEKKRISETLKARYASEGYDEDRREKIRQANLIQFSTSESRENHSILMKIFYEKNPDKKGIPLGTVRDPVTKKKLNLNLG